jgi:hypothetical protein
LVSQKPRVSLVYMPRRKGYLPPGAVRLDDSGPDQIHAILKRYASVADGLPTNGEDSKQTQPSGSVRSNPTATIKAREEGYSTMDLDGRQPYQRLEYPLLPSDYAQTWRRENTARRQACQILLDFDPMPQPTRELQKSREARIANSIRETIPAVRKSACTVHGVRQLRGDVASPEGLWLRLGPILGRPRHKDTPAQASPAAVEPNLRQPGTKPRNRSKTHDFRWSPNSRMAARV